jgi:MFS family permease
MFRTILSNRDVRLGIAAEFLSSFQWGSLSVILPIYLSKLSLQPVEIGLLLTISQATFAILSIPMGVVADLYGKRKTISLGSIIAGASIMLLAFVNDLYHLYIVGLLIGMGSSMIYSPLWALLADISPADKMDHVFSYSYSVSSLGIVVSSGLSITPSILRDLYGFGELESYKPLIIVSGITTALVALCVSMIRGEIKTARAGRIRDRIIPRRSLRVVYKIGIVDLLIGIGAGITIPLFPLWFYLRFGLDEMVLAPLYSVANIMLGISYLATPILSSRIGRINTVVLTQGTSILLLIAIPLIPDFLIVGLLFILRNLLMNMAGPIVRALVMNLTDPSERSTVSAFVSIAWSLPNSATPSIGGYLLQHVSLSIPFFLTALFYAAATLLFYIFFRNIERV